jgi:flagellar biosynthesis GTPase FlhF
MEVRSYYATSVEAAIETARRELGPDAMLIHSRRTNIELAYLGRYEVVFAAEDIEPEEHVPEKHVPEIAAQGAPSRPSPPRRPRPDVDNAGLGPVDLVGKLNFASVLRSAGVTPEMSREFFSGERPKPAPAPPSVATKHTIALVGPPGAGKTSILMKLALALGLAASRKVRILAFDPDRAGATHQLRHFAEIAGVGFAEFDTPEELRLALGHPLDGLTLIDTPGYSRAEGTALSVLAAAFCSETGIETHLVLRADTKTADNLSAIERFSAFAPARLIFAALDETEDHSDLNTLIGRAGTPVSFLAAGPQIDDLEPASTSRLAELVRDGALRSSRAAA